MRTLAAAGFPLDFHESPTLTVSTGWGVALNALPSVVCHFSFHGFPHSGNQRKPVKTKKRGNLETYVHFPGNLPQGRFRHYKIIIKLYHICTKFPFQVSGNQETSRNQWKPGNDFDILLMSLLLLVVSNKILSRPMAKLERCHRGD
jgi:hypothetical protein